MEKQVLAGLNLQPCKVYKSNKLKKACLPKYYHGRPGMVVKLYSDNANPDDFVSDPSPLFARPMSAVAVSTHQPMPPQATSPPHATTIGSPREQAVRVEPAGGTPHPSNLASTQPGGVPDPVLIGAWCYVSGDAPSVSTSIVVAQSEGSRLILEISPADGSRPRRDRVVLIESTTGGSVLIRSTNTVIPLAAGQYLDVVTDAAGASTPSGPFPFDYATLSGAPQDLQGLIADVAAERQTYEVP